MGRPYARTRGATQLLRRQSAASAAPGRGRPGSGTTEALLRLQRLAGNAAVAGLLNQPQAQAPRQSQTTTAEDSFAVTIRRPSANESETGRPLPAARSSADHDAEVDGADSGEVDAAQVTAALQGAAPKVPELQPGQSVALPDMAVPDSLDVPESDSVSGRIDFEPTVAQAGTVNPFGSTSWSRFTVAGQVVNATPGGFSVNFRLVNPITFNVSSPKTSIASATDPALTNANFARAASDLTPRMSVQNGKPARTQFWARDLTERHERFHSDERRRLNQAGASQAQAWLGTQTASSLSDVEALVAAVPGRVIAASRAAVGTLDEKESRAYGDGAASYKARAEAITAKGGLGPTAGGYPG